MSCHCIHLIQLFFDHFYFLLGLHILDHLLQLADLHFQHVYTLRFLLEEKLVLGVSGFDGFELGSKSLCSIEHRLVLLNILEKPLLLLLEVSGKQGDLLKLAEGFLLDDDRLH